MDQWETKGDEASIVLLGSFNPKIFHPEWFIRKGIVTEWDYDDADLVVVPDLAKIETPDNIGLLTVLNKFQARSTLASNYSALKDFVCATFLVLTETPVSSMGMNYSSDFQLQNLADWKRFGEAIAPPENWAKATGFFEQLDITQKQQFGLWDLTYNLPRDDHLNGFIRAKVSVQGRADEHVLRLAFNNHVDLESGVAREVPEILEDVWEKSLDFAQSMASRILRLNLEGES